MTKSPFLIYSVPGFGSLVPLVTFGMVMLMYFCPIIPVVNIEKVVVSAGKRFFNSFCKLTRTKVLDPSGKFLLHSLQEYRQRFVRERPAIGY